MIKVFCFLCLYLINSSVQPYEVNGARIQMLEAEWYCAPLLRNHHNPIYRRGLSWKRGKLVSSGTDESYYGLDSLIPSLGWFAAIINCGFGDWCGVVSLLKMNRDPIASLDGFSLTSLSQCQLNMLLLIASSFAYFLYVMISYHIMDSTRDSVIELLEREASQNDSLGVMSFGLDLAWKPSFIGRILDPFSVHFY